VGKEQSTVSIQGYTGFGTVYPSIHHSLLFILQQTFPFKPVDHRATNNFLNKTQVSSPDTQRTKRKKTRGIINGNHCKYKGMYRRDVSIFCIVLNIFPVATGRANRYTHTLGENGDLCKKGIVGF